LGLRRRNERRAEQRRNDEDRDRKFGLHKKVSPKISVMRRLLDAFCANLMIGQWRMFGK
jgi:hypothetical protein